MITRCSRTWCSCLWEPGEETLLFVKTWCLWLHSLYNVYTRFYLYVWPIKCTSPLYVCPLRVYSPLCAHALRVLEYVLSVHVPPYVCPLSVYVPSVCMCLVFPSCVCHLYVYAPLCVRPTVCIFLPCVCPFVCMSPSCVCPLHMYIPLYDCCWNSNSSNNKLMWQVSRIHRFTSVPSLG